MDTHPRAEDEGLPQHEASSQEPEAQLHTVAETVEHDLVAADEASAGDEAAAISDADETIVETASEPVADADVELSADELSTEVGVAPEAPEAPDLTAESSVEADIEVDAPAAEEAAPVVFAPEELAAQAPAIDDAGPATIAAPSIAPGSVSESEFAHMVDDALEAVGGILLFKMRLDEAGEDKHVAAASIGDGARRQFLLLSLPVTGGKLKVESASRSTSPLAKLAEAYVGVVEAFRAAA